MLDLKFIRENTELVRQAIANRQDTAPLDEILKLDGQRRQKLLELEELQVIMTCGGTGLGSRDITVETVQLILDKHMDGFGELFRSLS